MKNAIFFLLFSTTRLIAQTDNFTYFNKVFEADTMNMLSQVVRPIEDGYLVIGGYTTLTNQAIYILKLNLMGDLIWFKHLDEGSNLGVVEDGKFVVGTSDDKFVITYSKGQPVNGFGEIHLVKFDEEGVILWHKVHTDSSSKYAKQVIETTDGGFALVGVQGENSPARYYVLKTNAVGNFEWNKSYILDGSSAAFSIQETPWDGGFIIGGYAVNAASGTPNYDAWVIKTNYLGDTLWTRTYGGEGNDCAAFVIPLTTLEEYFFEGKPIEYLLTGCLSISGDIFTHLAKLDEFGNIIWEKKYNSLGGYNLIGFQTYPIIIRSNNVLENRSFLGACIYYSSGYWQSRIIKFYFSGTIAWHKAVTCNSDASVYLKDMQPTPDGGYVLAGYQYTPPQKGWVLKIDAQGNTCSPVGCDSTLFVSAPASPFGSAQLPPVVSISPNPVRDQLTFRHRLPAEYPVAMFILYNAAGMAVWQQEFVTWQEQHSWQLPPQLPSGLYLWQVSYMGETSASGKLVVSD